ncbi:acyl-CoA dehydrogenase family protein [Rubrivirga sp. IMCC45206]|uniref:acyl-CoA dehydrogenase family protein n=1 Tax=Rubrivirga sp. IMCC45206 TaxID=3391614 RepID=UPI0039903397
MSVLSSMKGVSARDQQMIQEAETMLGPEPEEMGFIKNLFWGRVREELVFPYPEVSAAEKAKTDALLAELNVYLDTEHPSILIDQEQVIPDWVIERLFEMGVMGMTVPEAYGGLGLGVASYNRVLEAIGRRCGSTAVMVSAHQSIGCKALMLFGTDDQKDRFLHMVAREKLSGFCLSEPQVGSDAAGQETNCVWDEKEGVYILNGEKKWITSGALSGLLTVMANQQVTDPKTGKTKKGVSALIVTPDMDGVSFFQKNRSKTGIRGTWQARIKFENVRVPKENLLHREGQGLKVALTCLNYGRCTLSAGVSGAAKQAAEQATKWVATRHQFQRPLADFELVQKRVAEMHALCFGMDAMLYTVCGMLDRHDSDIMVETAACKLFCSEEGWNVIDSAMQIMGGEGYVTENEFERLWRDNRIHRIVEGSNEVMQSFIFAYGGKQLAEYMLGVLNTVQWSADETAGENLSRIVGGALKPATIKAGTPLATEIFLGKKVAKPEINRVHPSLRSFADRLASHVQTHTREFKLASKRMEEKIVTAQVTQARLADNATLMFAWACTLSKLDQQIARGASGAEWERDKAAGLHFMHLAHERILANVRGLSTNSDDSMRRTAAAALAFVDTMPNEDFYIHESSPTAKGTGHPVQEAYIKQFPEDGAPFVPRPDGEVTSGDGAVAPATPADA